MKLFGLHYSPYALKVKALLTWMGERFEWVEVPYNDRDELAKVTGGYVHVPVLVENDGTVVKDSRAICERLIARAPRFAPAPLEGPIWGYHDFVDSALEDVMFRIASPAVRDAWERPGDRALYVLIKERKFGPGCVDAWERDRDALIARARYLLAPTLRTLEQRPFLFGDAKTLADAALYGNCKMLLDADASLLPRVAEPLVAWCRRLEAGP